MHSADGALRIGLGDGQRRLRCFAGVTDRGCATGVTAGLSSGPRAAQNIGPAYGAPRRARHHEVAQGRPDPGYSSGSVRCSGRVSVRDRSNETTLLNRLITRRLRQLTNAWSSFRDFSQTASGAVHCDFTASRTPKLLTERL
jgi:hypothetical protein